MKIMLGYQEIEIEEVEDLKHEDGEWVEGLWDAAKGKIRINAGMPDDQWVDTLVHECMHAISDIYGLDLDHSAIHTIAVGLTQMLGDRIQR